MATRKNPGFPAVPDNRVTTDAPSDGNEYVRKDGAWAVSSTLPTSGTVTNTVNTLETFPTQTNWTNQFDGDNSESAIQLDWRYENTGVNPFGSPGSSYLYAPHIAPVFAQLRVGENVGFNSTTTQNGPGRTGATVIRAKVSHAGQGDAVCFNASAFVSGTTAGATSWLASPAVVLFNGDMLAGADGVYLNNTEFRVTSGPYDCAAIGAVYNLDRDVDTGALGAGWDGIRIQSQGTAEINSGFRVDGLVDVVFNASRSTSTNQAALAMKSGHRIYFNASAAGDFGTTVGTTYQTFDGTGLATVVGGTTQLKTTATEVQINGFARIAGGGTIRSGSGSPEAVVSAPVGSLYLRTDGGAGTTLYVKESGGSTNTGWVAK